MKMQLKDKLFIYLNQVQSQVDKGLISKLKEEK